MVELTKKYQKIMTAGNNMNKDLKKCKDELAEK